MKESESNLAADPIITFLLKLKRWSVNRGQFEKTIIHNSYHLTEQRLPSAMAFLMNTFKTLRRSDSLSIARQLYSSSFLNLLQDVSDVQ